MFFLSVLCLLCLCVRLLIRALWSPAGKGLTSWRSFVVSGCEFVTFPLVILLVQIRVNTCLLSFNLPMQLFFHASMEPFKQFMNVL